jgi:ParB family transcriptional regulator, chromosome partitioning protein
VTTANQPAEPAALIWLDPRSLADPDGNIRSDLGDLTEMVASMKVVGVLEPLVVVAHPDGHRVLAGRRRAAAAAEAGLASVPCWPRPDLAELTASVAAQIVENHHRKALNPAVPSGIASAATFRSGQRALRLAAPAA